MAKVLFGLFVLTIALVGPESQCWATDQERSIKGGKDADASALLSRPPLPYSIQIVMAQMALGTFGIGGGPFDGIWTSQTQRAVNAYQKIRGIPLTQDLNQNTFESLSKDLEEWRQQVPDPPPLTIDFTHWENGHVSAIGTWMSDKKERWNLIHVTSLNCWRKGMLCVEATAEYRENANRIGVGQRFYMIAHWNETEIVTVNERDNCPVSTVRIERSTEAVTGIRFPDGQEACPQQGTPLALRLTDGYMVKQQADLAKMDRFRSLIQAPGFALPDGSGRH